MKILFFGDVVGKAGRLALAEILPKWRKRYSPDFVIANAENAAHGHGVTPSILDELGQAGVDAFTAGDHVTDDHLERLADYPIVRPANLSGKHPGAGARLFETALHRKVLVINLLGNAFLKPRLKNFFNVADEVLAQHRHPQPDAILVDFHAEATSEKTALAFHLDGKVSALVGTHTHVPTADGRIFPKGLAYQSDVGMVGTLEGVLGFYAPVSIRWLRKEMGESVGQVPLAVSEERPYVVDAVLIDVASRHRSRSIKRLTTRPT